MFTWLLHVFIWFTSFQILGGAKHDEDLAHPDPFLRSMALWMCKQYKKSLSTLLSRNIGIAHPLYDKYICKCIYCIIFRVLYVCGSHRLNIYVSLWWQWLSAVCYFMYQLHCELCAVQSSTTCVLAASM